MAVYTPSFLGLILRKNERTRRFIDQQVEFLLERFPEAGAHLNEDEHLIGFSVAMNGRDLQSAIEQLEEHDAVHGTDFVATQSAEGVLGNVPDWLIEKTVRHEAAPMQLTKIYSFTPKNAGLKP